MSKNINFDFYYGNEAEQFSFYRIPKELITNDIFKEISLSAKLIYGMLHDRLSLSIKNGWVDDDGRVYICYSQEQLAEDLKLSIGTICAKLKELDVKNGIGLIERKRIGLGRNDVIYVKKFILLTNENKETRNTKVQKSKNYKSRITNISNQQLYDLKCNKTKGSHIETKQTESINQSASDKADCTDSIDAMDIVDLVKENIEYDYHMSDDINIEDRDLFYDLYQIIIDIVTVPRDKIRLGKAEFDYNIVRSQMLKLTGEHIDYVIDSYRATTTEIRDIRSYLTTSLYYAPTTYKSHMVNQIRHDQYGRE